MGKEDVKDSVVWKNLSFSQEYVVKVLAKRVCIFPECPLPLGKKGRACPTASEGKVQILPCKACRILLQAPPFLA